MSLIAVSGVHSATAMRDHRVDHVRLPASAVGSRRSREDHSRNLVEQGAKTDGALFANIEDES